MSASSRIDVAAMTRRSRRKVAWRLQVALCPDCPDRLALRASTTPGAAPPTKEQSPVRPPVRSAEPAPRITAAATHSSWWSDEGRCVHPTLPRVERGAKTGRPPESGCHPAVRRRLRGASVLSRRPRWLGPPLRRRVRQVRRRRSGRAGLGHELHEGLRVRWPLPGRLLAGIEAEGTE